MFPPLILVAAGGLAGFVHERFRRKRLAKAISSNLPRHEKPAESVEPELQMATGDRVQIRNAERSAHLGLGVAAVGIFLPLLTAVALPIIGYSVYNWTRTRYQFERPKHKSPLSILAALAMLSTLVTGFWIVVPIVLSADLAARKWLANWTKGSQWIDDWPVNDLETSEMDRQFLGLTISGRIVQRARYLLRAMLLGEPRWEWVPALVARVSLGLFFAISGWNKLFMVSHWNGLVEAMISTGLPFPKFLSLFLASVEFYGGSLLTIGFLSTIWSIALAFAMIVALVTVEIPTIIPPGLGPLDWLDWFLYLPQVMYVLIFMWLVIKGPGPYSVDAVIARKLGLDKDGDEANEEDTDTTIVSEQKSEPSAKSNPYWTSLQPA